MTCYFKNAFDCDGAGDQIGDRVLLDAVKRGTVSDVQLCLDDSYGLLILDVATGKNWRPQQLFDGRTALHVAIHNEKEDVVKMLLEYGAKTYTTDSYGLAPLHAAAAYRGSMSIISLLLDHGADIDAPSTGGDTKHHRQGWCEMLEFSTPIMVACWWGYLDVVKVLVGRGANLSATNMHGLTAFDIANERRHHGILEYLVEVSGGRPLFKRAVELPVLNPTDNGKEGDDDHDDDDDDGFSEAGSDD